MFSKPPRNTERFSWTKHAIEKMRFYGLGESKIKSVIARFDRKETGVAPRTTAVMRRAGSKRPTEIWVMYKKIKSKLTIISAWRYPGISPVREVPVPQDVREELGI
jgi:hypothetical protein